MNSSMKNINLNYFLFFDILNYYLRGNTTLAAEKRPNFDDFSEGV